MSDPFADLLSSLKGGNDLKKCTQAKKPDSSLALNDLLLAPKKAQTTGQSTSNISLNALSNQQLSTFSQNIHDDMADLFGCSTTSNVAPIIPSSQPPSKDDLDAVMDLFNNSSTSNSYSTIEQSVSQENKPFEYVVDEVKDMEIAKLMSLDLSIDEANIHYERGELYDTLIKKFRRSQQRQVPYRTSSISPQQRSDDSRSPSNPNSFSMGGILNMGKQLVDQWTVYHNEDNRLFRNTDFHSQRGRNTSNASNSNRGQTSESLPDPFEEVVSSISTRNKETIRSLTSVNKSSNSRVSVEKQHNILLPDFLDNFESTVKISDTQPIMVSSVVKPQEKNIIPALAIPSPVDNSLLDFDAPSTLTTASNTNQLQIVSISDIELSGYKEFRNRGTEFFKNGDYVSSLGEYEKALNNLPVGHSLRIIAYSNILASLLKIGEYKRSIEVSKAALDIFPADPKQLTAIIQNSEPSRSFIEIWPKIIQRRAEAFEHIENYQEAFNNYRLLIENNIFDEKILASKRRCQKVLNPAPNNIAKNLTPTTSAKPKAETKPSEHLLKVQENNRKEEEIEAQKLELHDKVESKINEWVANKNDDIRYLLSNLALVLTWTNWKPIPVTDLVMPKRVKIAYMKAVARTHPDKILNSLDLESKMIAENIFSILSKAWEKFKTENKLN